MSGRGEERRGGAREIEKLCVCVREKEEEEERRKEKKEKSAFGLAWRCAFRFVESSRVEVSTEIAICGRSEV